MPQPWVIWRPFVSWIFRASAGESGEPPETATRRKVRSTPFAWACSPSWLQIVGTAASMVGRVCSIMAARCGAWRNLPVITKRDPATHAAWIQPQALAWNIGTTGSAVSASVKP